jgi:hypothetical protein
MLPSPMSKATPARQQVPRGLSYFLVSINPPIVAYDYLLMFSLVKLCIYMHIVLYFIYNLYNKLAHRNHDNEYNIY